MQSVQAPAVGVVVHGTPSDGDVLAATLPYLIDSADRAGARTFLVVDNVALAGRLAANDAAASARVTFPAFLEHLGKMHPDLVVTFVDRSAAALQQMGARFFGSVRMPASCSAGTPLHSFLVGLVTPGTRFVVHYDADMLLHDSASWVREATDLLRSDERRLIVNPHRGTPREDCGAADGGGVCHCSPTSREVSTRCFAIDMDRLNALTPLSGLRHQVLRQAFYSLRGRSTARPLEHILTDYVDADPHRLYTLPGSSCYTIHGLRREFFTDGRISKVLADVAAGRLPTWQCQEENLLGPW